MLAQTRQQGYALRSKDVRPVSNTLAVPVFENGHVLATLGVTWFSSAMDTDAAVAALLPRMQQAARDVEARLVEVGAPPARGAAVKVEPPTSRKRPKRALPAAASRPRKP
jgi:hypothetical protein